jgi:prepilin-type N-terminal cleavage/methylation domain-containing protein
MSSGHSRRRSGFTLIELLAVLLLILVLAGSMIHLASYLQRRVATSTTRAQLDSIVLALEMYRSDYGFYPRTTEGRISGHGLVESTNNAILVRALLGSGRLYLTGIPPEQIKVHGGTGLTNIFDVFGQPFNYYNSPQTPFALVNNSGCTNCGYTVGGQVNLASFDLFSYGPDRMTLAATNANAQNANYTTPYVHVSWRLPASAVDDITNWGR